MQNSKKPPNATIILYTTQFAKRWFAVVQNVVLHCNICSLYIERSLQLGCEECSSNYLNIPDKLSHFHPFSLDIQKI